MGLLGEGGRWEEREECGWGGEEGLGMGEEHAEGMESLRGDGGWGGGRGGEFDGSATLISRENLEWPIRTTSVSTHNPIPIDFRISTNKDKSAETL